LISLSTSSICPRYPSGTAFGISLWIKIIVLSRFPQFLSYHGFPRRAVESSRIFWLGKRGNAFPFSCRHVLLTFVRSANNPHDRLYLISVTRPLQYFWTGTGKDFALLLLFIKPACKRAGNHRRSFLVLEPARSEVHIFLFSKMHRKAFQTPTSA
jgi:hypothetical protein